jgi:hypothetical protein
VASRVSSRLNVRTCLLTHAAKASNRQLWIYGEMLGYSGYIWRWEGLGVRDGVGRGVGGKGGVGYARRVTESE